VNGTEVPASIPSAAATPPATDRQTAIKFLTISFDECSKQLNTMPAERWNTDVYKFKGQPVLASEAHHRAHAEVYLRLKNIKPPAWRF
jgi:hypothetical protein